MSSRFEGKREYTYDELLELTRPSLYTGLSIGALAGAILTALGLALGIWFWG